MLMEVDVLSNRLRNIKQSFRTTHNKGLKERLFSENKNIFKRINEIYKIAMILNEKTNEEINYTNLLSFNVLLVISKSNFEKLIFSLFLFKSSAIL